MKKSNFYKWLMLELKDNIELHHGMAQRGDIKCISAIKLRDQIRANINSIRLERAKINV